MRAHRYRYSVAFLAALALALRCVGIAGLPLQWDEGWTIALARLPPGDALRLTALDVLLAGLAAVLLCGLVSGPVALIAAKQPLLLGLRR